MNKINKLTIYEGTACGCGGECCTTTDQNLMEFQYILGKLIKHGVIVERYSITQNPKKFMEDQKIVKLVQSQDLKVLPVTVLNDNVVKVSSYPTRDELASLLGFDINDDK